MEVSDTDLKYDDRSPIVTGRITNTTSEEKDCYIEVVFYNSEGKAIAVTESSVDNIPVNGKKSFENSGYFIENNIKSTDITDYKVFARITNYFY